MLTAIPFLARSDDGRHEVVLCECFVDNDTSTMRNERYHTAHRDRYVREALGGPRLEEVEPGVFRLPDGKDVRRVDR